MTRSTREPRPRLLLPYVLAVGVLGAALMAVVVTQSNVALAQMAEHALPLGLLAGLVVVGELRPIPITRGQLGRADPTPSVITISTTFAIAMVVLGPLALVLLVQGAAVVLEDVRNGRRPAQVLFNLGQYALAMTAARGVYVLFAGPDLLAGYTTLQPTGLLPALAAGVVFCLVNEGLVTVAASLATRTSLVALLREDWAFRTETSALLVVLGVVATALAASTPLLVPLVALPVLAVRRSAALAAAREHEALHDPLTGLGNREVLRLSSQRALDGADDPQQVGVLVLDLDDFREINDTLGHPVGDEVLQLVAHRLQALDAPGSTLVRLGGDEFGVLLPATDTSRLTDVAEQMLGALGRPLQVGNSRITMRASVGAALGDDGRADAHSLLRHADIALYQAKREKCGYQVYDSCTDVHSQSRLSLLSDLHEAVDGRQMRVLFQPQLDVATDRVVSVEALVRWRHPQRGLLGPEVFLPMAENAGLGERISRVVLDQTLAAARHWLDNGWDVGVSVNVSARQLGELAFPGRVAMCLQSWRVPPSRLTLEVTESGVMGDALRTAQVMHELRETGVRMAIDDFGTGHSSLVRLQRLAVDELKIDRSFVTWVASESNDEILVRSVVDLGRNLGLTVVAEGVETHDVAMRLRELGCDRLQGFLLGRPMERDAVDELLRQQQAAAAAEEHARVVRMRWNRRTDAEGA